MDWLSIKPRFITFLPSDFASERISAVRGDRGLAGSSAGGSSLRRDRGDRRIVTSISTPRGDRAS